MMTPITTDAAALEAEAFRATLDGRAIRHNGRTGRLARDPDGALVAVWANGAREKLTAAMCGAGEIDVRPGDFTQSTPKQAAAPEPVPAPAAPAAPSAAEVERIAGLLAKSSPDLAASFVKTMGYRTPAMVAADRAAAQAEADAAARAVREAELKRIGDMVMGRPVAPKAIDVPPGQEKRAAHLASLGKAVSAHKRGDAMSGVAVPPGQETRLAQLQAIGRAAR